MSTWLPSYSQEAKQQLDSLLDEIVFEDSDLVDALISKEDYKYNFFYLNSSYDGQSTFAGRDLGLNQFNITSQLMYFNSSGFNARIYGIWYSELEPHYNVTGLSIGYSFYPSDNKKWRLRAAYDRYFFADNGSEETSNLSNSLTAGVSYKLTKNINTSLNSSFLIGNGSVPQLSWSTYGNFKLYKKSYNKYVSFRPSISMLMTSESYVTQFEQFTRRFGTVLVEEEERSFGLMSTRISLPISLNIKDWDFEIGYNYILPSSPLGLEDSGLNNVSYISFSIGKLINIK